ncbi:MAG: alpha/beta hydrolase [Anaerolineaceae bacterium]|nr:alpha/beta hydrolase [Anaerolineaceae bacterium]
MPEFITQKESFGKILARKELKDMARFILPIRKWLPNQIMRLIPLSVFQTLLKNRQVNEAIDGLNQIIEHTANGVRVYHDFWEEEDKADDPRRHNTALFHFPAKEKSPFVLICPGGAYRSVASIIEGYPVAAALNRIGYTAFVLHYRVGEETIWPTHMEDLWKVMTYILSHAEELNVDVEDYAVMGFSAGGHLAASVGTGNFGYDCWLLPKPGALILGYPVIHFENMTRIHQVCLNTFAGKMHQPKHVRAVTITNHIDHDTPPTYVWQCRDDNAVNFDNSEVLARKLAEANVPYIHKAVPSGGHGIGLGTGTPAEGWLEEAVEFWQSQRKRG